MRPALTALSLFAAMCAVTACTASEAADMSDVTSPASAWVEVYSDNGARPGATFQSHVRKLRDHDGALTLAYTHQGETHAHSRVVRIPHGGRPRGVSINKVPSNPDCIVVWDDRVRHVYADFTAKTLYVDDLDGSAPVAFADFYTAGKTSCREVGGDLLVATSYGEVWRLAETDEGIAHQIVREKHVVEQPESLQYPYIQEGRNALGGVSVLNTSSMVGFFYRDLYMSECDADGLCSEFEGLFPVATRASNSWVGDVARSDDGSLVAYWTENDFHFASEKMFTRFKDSTAYVGVYRNSVWKTVALGPRIISGLFLRRGDELLLVSMGLTGEVFVQRVEGGGSTIANTLEDGPELVAYQNLKVACAYALDADLAEGVLSLALTDRGQDCASETGNVRVWRHVLDRPALDG